MDKSSCAPVAKCQMSIATVGWATGGRRTNERRKQGSSPQPSKRRAAVGRTRPGAGGRAGGRPGHARTRPTSPPTSARTAHTTHTLAAPPKEPNRLFFQKPKPPIPSPPPPPRESRPRLVPSRPRPPPAAAADADGLRGGAVADAAGAGGLARGRHLRRHLPHRHLPPRRHQNPLPGSPPDIVFLAVTFAGRYTPCWGLGPLFYRGAYLDTVRSVGRSVGTLSPGLGGFLRMVVVLSVGGRM